MMKKILILGLLVLAVVVLAGCAAGPNELTDAPDDDGHISGFWSGLWHGIIAPITFAISLFSDNVSLYDVHNSGGWYDFGFLVGLAGVWGGGGAAGSRRK